MSRSVLENPIGIETLSSVDTGWDKMMSQRIRKPNRDWNKFIDPVLRELAYVAAY